jgi:16S rRNA processing protein RimM
MTAEKVLLGRITGAHGLKGEVKIAAFTGAPEDIGAYGALTNADGTRHYHISAVRSVKGGTVIACIRGVSNRDEAEKLRGADLYVPRAALPQVEDDDEFYHSDLIGMAAVSPGGDSIGEVIAVHNFGAGDLLEVRFEGERETALIPFESACVPRVDIAERRVVIVRPVYEQDESAEAQ